jgi:MFS family permease
MPAGTATAKAPPPPAIRWAVLFFLSLAMFGNYYVYDSIAPLVDMLQTQLGFSATQVGALNGIYHLPNILMVLIGGIIVDRIGTRTATFVFTLLCVVGALLTASSGTFVAMAAGRLVFGLGAESMIVAVTTALGQWFKGRQLGFAFGLNLSLARAGSYAADLSPAWAGGAYAAGWREPLLIAVSFAIVALAGAAVFWILERGAATRYEIGLPPPADRIIWSDVWRFNPSYWYVVGLCVTFYSVIFPFRSTFAIEYFQNGHGLALADASRMNSYVFLAAIFATPAFGLLVDRTGRRAFYMAFGSLLLMSTFPILLYTNWSLWVSTVLIGIAFSLVPAVLWPSVAYLVEERRLGTAYGVMTMLQNVGLTGANFAAGALNDFGGAGASNPGGYRWMLWMFTILSLSGLVFSELLRRRETGPGGHGLETIRASGM